MAGQLTDPLASGGSTPQGKLAIFISIAGTVIGAVGGVAPMFSQAAQQNPNTLWLQLASLVCGAAMAVASNESLHKSTRAAASGAIDLLTQAEGVVAPLLAAALIKKYASSLAPVGSTSVVVTTETTK